MESTSQPQEVQIVKQPPPQRDLVSFLKVTYNVNPLFSKFATVGLFKDLEYKVGVLLHKQGMRKYILMDSAQFSDIRALEKTITYAINHKSSTRRFDAPGLTYTIRYVYYLPNIEVKDPKNKISFMFSMQEWLSFVALMPCIDMYIQRLSCVESYLIEHIDRVMRSDSVYVPPPQEVNGWDGDRLHDEVQLYKRSIPTND